MSVKFKAYIEIIKNLYIIANQKDVHIVLMLLSIIDNTRVKQLLRFNFYKKYQSKKTTLCKKPFTAHK